MTLRDLHKFAYRRLPRAQCHDLLHAWAVERFGVASLTECTPAQITALAALVNSHPPPVASHQSSEPGAQATGATHHSSPMTHDSPPPRRRAARSGKRREPGVVKMISERQIDFIHTLCSELGWTADTLRLLCERVLGLARCSGAPPWPPFDAREIGSAAAASKVINTLIAENRRRAQRK